MAIATALGTCPTCKQETFPAEPPLESVVLDRDKEAWQSREDGWDGIDSTFQDYTWRELLHAAGPVTVLYTS
ncbi:hypothetical protein [Nonomuraea sp. NPDC049129]|uniref:hypothetical protein n=1 Tax=Nonomuraea sp. NPDC049129 TaxID=3155272 RepID=UPI0033F811A8